MYRLRVEGRQVLYSNDRNFFPLRLLCLRGMRAFRSGGRTASEISLAVNIVPSIRCDARRRPERAALVGAIGIENRIASGAEGRRRTPQDSAANTNAGQLAQGPADFSLRGLNLSS